MKSKLFDKNLYKQKWQNLTKYKKVGFIFALLILLGLIGRVFYHPTHAAPVILVEATAVKLADVPLIISNIGTVEATQSVTIMPQVTGQLTKIEVTPGQQVEAGQPLFEIDSDTENAILKQNQAVLARDKAQLAYLEANSKRYANLVKLEYVTRDQYEQTKAAAAAQEALVASDEQQVKQAEIDVEHTRIVSPISGKVGNFTVRTGDLMVANTTTMVVINQLSPVWIDFTVPQQQLPVIRLAKKQENLQVNIYDEDGKQKLAEASLFFIDNTVNSSTGTILLKAEADNKDYMLWPGQMIRVKLLLQTAKNVPVLPLQAVQLDNEGSFVYVLENNKAVIKRIKVARQYKQIALIESGLKPGELVLTAIPPNLEEGAKVRLKTGKAE